VLKSEWASFLEQSVQVVHEQHQMHRIDWSHFEVEMQVEPFGVVVDCMDEHGADAYRVGGLGSSHKRIKQQRSAETLALLPSIYRKPAQQSNANRVIGETFGNSRRASSRRTLLAVSE
jgi:hypothetical protein